MLLIRVARCLCATLVIAAGSARSGSMDAVDAPIFKSGSKWVYHITATQQSGKEASFDYQWTLVYETADSYWAFFLTPPNPDLPYSSADPAASQPRIVPSIAGLTKSNWAGRDPHPGLDPRSADLDVPLEFPLTLGKTWIKEFERPAQSGTRHVVNRHQVVGWEDVKVEGVDFHALRIETETEMRVTTSSASGADLPPPTSTTHTVDWYVPAVQNFVRERIEFPGGFTNLDLKSFKLAN